MKHIICTVEGCGRMSENRDIGLCPTHNREARKSAAPKEKPKRQRIAKQSDNQKDRLAIYYGIRKLFLEVNPYCRAHEICFPGSNNAIVASDIHHQKGKCADLLFDVRYWLPVCRACHSVITVESEWAYNEGLSLSRDAIETV